MTIAVSESILHIQNRSTYETETETEEGNVLFSDAFKTFLFTVILWLAREEILYRHFMAYAL